MLTAYILMVMCWYGSHSYAGFSAEFNNLAACEEGGRQANSTFGGIGTRVYTKCVSKGDKSE